MDGIDLDDEELLGFPDQIEGVALGVGRAPGGVRLRFPNQMPSSWICVQALWINPFGRWTFWS